MQDQVNRIDLAAIVSGPACNAMQLRSRMQCEVLGSGLGYLSSMWNNQMPTPVMVNGRSVND